MKVGFLFLLSVIFFLTPINFRAGATALNLELNTTEHLNDLVFYPDGTHTCGNITGCLSIKNPSLNHTVSSIDINFSNCITPPSAHINELEPNGTAMVSYELESSKVSLPVITETVTPSFLCSGVKQEVIFEVEISNPGCEDLRVLWFEKTFPRELKFVDCTLSEGTLNITGNNFQWENFSVNSRCRERLKLVFTITPVSDLAFSASNISFITPAFEASRNFSLSAVTNTRFAVEKQRLGEGEWKVGVIVEDASEFDFLLYNVKVYVSDTMLNEPRLIRDYYLNSSLKPGEYWQDSFTYKYSGTPVFFAKICYTIPYSIYGSMTLNSVGNGNIAINSVISGDKIHHDSHDSHRLTIITPMSTLSENISAPQSSSQTDKKSHESFSSPENSSFLEFYPQTNQVGGLAEDGVRVSRLLPFILLFLGLLGLLGGRILSFPSFLWKK